MGVRDFETVSLEHGLEQSLRSPIALDHCDLGRRSGTTTVLGKRLRTGLANVNCR